MHGTFPAVLRLTLSGGAVPGCSAFSGRRLLYFRVNEGLHDISVIAALQVMPYRTRAVTVMKQRLKQIFQRQVDEVVYSQTARTWRVAWLMLRHCLNRNPALRIEAYEKAESPFALRLAGQDPSRMLTSVQTGPPLEQWHGIPRFERVRLDRSQLTRSILLKTPGANGERGVLAMLFEYNWHRLLSGISDLHAFTSEHDLLLCTSWSPTHYPLLAHLLEKTTGNLYVQVCNQSEIPKLEAFHPRLKCAPPMGCDWILPSVYQPKPHQDREFDFVMVANWAPFKRHFEFFEALSRMPRHIRVAFVGQPEGSHTVLTAQAAAKQLGVHQDVTWFNRVPIERVREIQCNSKTAVILSRREGCCVAAVEALLADTPLGMREDAHVGPLAYIHEKTGRRFSTNKPMHMELMSFLEASSGFRPRDWAVENVSCHASLQKLNHFLREEAVVAGRPWTTDLTPVCWAPYPTFVSFADREKMRPHYLHLHEKYPAVFARDLADTSHL